MTKSEAYRIAAGAIRHFMSEVGSRKPQFSDLKP